jgi:hypothetical protein
MLVKQYYSSGEILCKTYWKDNLSYRHRIRGPAFIEYYKSGKIKLKQYWLNNKRHRLTGPAIVWYNKHGKCSGSVYWLNDIYLPLLTDYISSKNNLFLYIKKYPRYINEIEILARHNNWLSEKELDLLSCMSIFAEI